MWLRQKLKLSCNRRSRLSVFIKAVVPFSSCPRCCSRSFDRPESLGDVQAASFSAHPYV